jgi:hypothetical protein
MTMDDCYDFTLVLSGGVIDWIENKKLVSLSQVFTWPVFLPPLDDKQQTA